jgi:hydroxymethylbilane synthase
LKARTLRIGTRGSLLALQQSQWVRDELTRNWPELTVELQVIKTTGDKILDVPLAKVGGKGLFVKEIEDALQAGEVDLAVHSMKDMPARLPDGLIIAAIPQREDPRDVLVAHGGSSLEQLPRQARIGTSSLRRAAQAKAIRPDLRIENLRGNLDTRLRKAEEGQYDAVILAAAGLHRMGWQKRITHYLPPERFLPAVGQGALGIEARADDAEVLAFLKRLHNPATAVTVTAERSFLAELEGGCQVPIGGHACILGQMVELDGLIASIDGTTLLRRTGNAPLAAAAQLGRRIAQELLVAGGQAILDEVYG